MENYDYDQKYIDSVFTDFGQDAKKIENLKKDYLDTGEIMLKALKSVKAYRWLLHSSLLFEQMIHLGNYSVPSNRYSFFNTGIPNMLCVMTGGYRNFIQNSGKSYFICGVTSDIREISKVYGNVFTLKMGENIYYRTKWLRLPGHRIEFLKDSFFSVLASTLSTLCRIRSQKEIVEEDVRGVFVIRAMVSMAPNQKFIEKLMDSRYAILSSLSSYTNFESLINEKLGPPYHNSIETWVVKRLQTYLDRFRRDVFKKGNIKFINPVFTELKQRNFRSVGGKVDIQAVWSNRKLTGIQDILDELFLYVHTPKEPSNIHHEEVKALNVITEYQRYYNGLTDLEKRGEFKSLKDLEEWLLKEPKVGFSKLIVKWATQNKMKTLDVNIASSEKKSFEEELSLLTSTKAVIPNERKKIIQDREKALKSLMHITKHPKLDKTIIADQLETKIKVNKEIKGKRKAQYHLRKKVHDCLIPLLGKGLKTVTEAVADHLATSVTKVCADICVKAQYGAKREFYVMNMGAKMMSRLVETFYKELCKSSNEEMISVPGDNKFLRMQHLLDTITFQAIKDDLKLIYVNGDCSKWSASECMESFITMNESIKFESAMFQNYLSNIFAQWADKKIQVPKNMVDKVFPMDVKTEYIKEASENNYCLKSTQNFLQGVFNYASSFKSDCAMNYVCYLWYKIYPESTLKVKYLVHSDDYVTNVAYKKDEEFEKFRVLQKIIMKGCGITDSKKKTSCQHIFMEFISLISFNSSMAYPTIKKTKEVASTLPAEGYSEDSDFVCARTSELLRVGVDFCGAYLFHRIHMFTLRRSYGLHEGGVNEMKNKFNIPVEMFGQSDMLPIFYLLNKGDPNNTRLLRFTESGSKYLSKLLDLTKLYSGLGDASTIGTFKITFIYNRYTEKIKELRKLCGLSPEEASDFWIKNIAYNFCKPRNHDDLIKWCKAKYYNNSFVKAYNRDNRTVRLLRLARFARGHMLTLKNYSDIVKFYAENIINKRTTKTSSWREEMMTINQMQKIFENFQQNDYNLEELTIFAYNGDANVDNIYRWIETANFQKSDVTYYQNTCASKIVDKPAWIQYSSNINMLIMFLSSKTLFEKNYPETKNLTQLMYEEQLLTKDYPNIIQCIKDDTVEPKIRLNSLSLLFKMLVNNSPQSLIVLSKKRHNVTLSNFLMDIFEISCYPGFRTSVTAKMIITSTNPYTNQKTYVIGNRLVSGPERHIANELGLLITFLISKLNASKSTVKRVLQSCTIDHFNKKINILNFLKNKTWLNLVLTNCSRFEVMVYAFALLYLYNDSELLQLMSKQTNQFMYQFDNKDEKTYKGERKGILRLTILYMNFLGHMTVNHNTKKHYLLTNCQFPNIAKTIYEIGLSMCDITGKKILETSLGKTDLTKFVQDKKWKRTGLILKSIGKNRFVYVDSKGQQVKALPVFYRDKLGVNIPDHRGSMMLEIPSYEIKNISIFKGLQKVFTLPYLRLINSHCIQATEDIIVENFNLKDIINLSITKQFLQAEYDEMSTNLSSIFIEKTKENIITSFPLPCDDAEKLNLLLPDTVTYKGKLEEHELMDVKKQEAEIKISQDVYMENINEAFTFDISDIELLDEEQVGLIDEDKINFPDPDFKEESKNIEKLSDITHDTYFGNMGTIFQMEFYHPDYTIPYTLRKAQQACNFNTRICELNLHLDRSVEYKAKHKLMMMLLSWYLKNFGENDYEITSGELLEEFYKVKVKLKKEEEKINGHVLISDGKDIKLYKTKIFNLNNRDALPSEKKQKLDSLLWDGIPSQEWLKKEENKTKKYIHIYTPVKYNLHLINYLIDYNSKLNLFTYPNEINLRLQKKIQEALVEDDF